MYRHSFMPDGSTQLPSCSAVGLETARVEPCRHCVRIGYAQYLVCRPYNVAPGVMTLPFVYEYSNGTVAVPNSQGVYVNATSCFPADWVGEYGFHLYLGFCA